MNGKWRLELPPTHFCAKPALARDSAIGAIWQCICGQSFECTSDPAEYLPYWSPVSERQVRRALRKAGAS
jgi:hypothetical protein